MKIISLKKMSQADLISSDLPGPSVNEWAVGTAYTTDSADIKVSKDEDDNDIAPIKTFRCVLDNTGVYPPDDDGTNWLDLGATNRWAMFDEYVMSSSASTTPATSTVASGFTVSINTSKMTDVALFNLGVKNIYVEYSSGGGAYAPLTQANFPNQVRLTEDYYPKKFYRYTKNYTDYLFGDWVWKRDVIIPIPQSSVSYVRIWFQNTTIGEYASCGQCVSGISYEIGKTQYGASSGILSFSRKERNDYFGITYLKKGNFAKKMDLDVMITNDKYNKVYSLLADADGVPAIFQGNNTGSNYEPFMIYGFTKSFNMSLQYQSHSECDLEIEGLI